MHRTLHPTDMRLTQPMFTHQPAQRAPAPGKGGDVDADDNQQADRHAAGQGGGGVALELHRQDGAGGDQAGNHLDAALQEQEAPAKLVDCAGWDG